ncbi:MAG: hypothetical protein ACOYJQ_07675 [Pseudochelatococcus sp.]|jgi:hypothetical protein|uniref:hypothetical protein n=1 Tax=Pseudochelatococcus sp. TaxID=2020869 RepID=UPI003D8E5A9C
MIRKNIKKTVLVSAALCASVLAMPIPAGGAPAKQAAAGKTNEAPAQSPAFFGLPVVDGAVAIADPNHYGHGKKAEEYQRAVIRLVYQLAYQADPSLIERNPKLFAGILPEEVRQKFLGGYLSSAIEKLDDPLVSLVWRARNEFEVDEVKARMTAALKAALEKTRIPDSFDIIDIRYAALGNYDRDAEAFPLNIETGQNRNAVVLRGMLPFAAPLPFAEWPRQLAMSFDDARAYLDKRNSDRHGYIATRMTLTKAEIASKRLELSFIYKGAAYYRDLALSRKDIDLPAFEGAYEGPDRAPSADERIPFVALAPDAPFVMYVKQNPGAAIPDEVWSSVAASRFGYEQSLLGNTLRYASVPDKRFPYTKLRLLKEPDESLVQAYKAAVIADTAPVAKRVSCPIALKGDNSDAPVTELSSTCQLTPARSISNDVRSDIGELLKKAGYFSLLEHKGSYTSILWFQLDDDPSKYERKLEKDEITAAPYRISYEFEVDQVAANIGKRLFAVEARLAGMQIGDKFVPVDKPANAAETKSLPEFADIVGLRLGMKESDADALLAVHAQSLENPETFKYRLSIDEANRKDDFNLDQFHPSGLILESEHHSTPVTPSNDGTSSGRPPGRLVDQTGVYYSEEGTIVAVTRYQAFPEQANIEDIRKLIVAKYGDPVWQDAPYAWHGIWAQAPAAQRSFLSGGDLESICGINMGRSVSDVTRRVSGNRWHDDQGAVRPDNRAYWSIPVTRHHRACGGILMASVDADGFWLGLIDTDWFTKRTQDVAAHARQRAEEQSRKAVAPARF